jgi:glucose/arabinose dehydrogenase
MRSEGTRRLSCSLVCLSVFGCSSDPVEPAGEAAVAASTGLPGAGAASASTGHGPSGQGGGGSGGSGSENGGSGATALVDCSSPIGDVPPLTLTLVGDGFTNPVLVTSSREDTSRLYVVERRGLVWIVEDGVLLPAPFLDLSAVVLDVAESGLIGLAFHPDYERNGRFFVHYNSQPALQHEIGEYRRSVDPDLAEPTPVAQVLSAPQHSGDHSGGAIEFGSDGFLYVAIGDGGSAGDELNLAQNLGSYQGKILRIDVSTSPYSIPPGNLGGAGVLPEIWDYGFRNPWRMSFDACKGDLYIGDVGLWSAEEINVEPAGAGNRNYGWRLKEGTTCFHPPADCDPANVTTPPTVTRNHNDVCAVIGGHVYRGASIPALRGAYLYGDYCSGRIWSFVWAAGNVMSELEHSLDRSSPQLMISSFGQDALGEVYVVDLQGSVFRIDPG